MLPESALASALLEETSEKPRCNPLRRAVIGIAATGSLLGVALLASSFGTTENGELAVTGLYALEHHCPIDTGGSCLINNCFAWRGETECSATFCNCKRGQCAGWDGRCADHTYEKIASGIKLRNAKWPDNYMYMSATYAIKGSSDPEDKGTFTAYRVPGHRDTASGGWRLMLVSEAYPSYAIGTKGSVITSLALGSSGVPQMSLEFKEAPCTGCEAHPLIMTSAAQKNLFFYENSWTSGLHTSSDDPGEAGYWYMEPFIPQILGA